MDTANSRTSKIGLSRRRQVELCASSCLGVAGVREMIVRLKRIEGTSSELRKNKYECIPLKPKEGVHIKIRIPVATASTVKSESELLDPNDFICNKTLPFKRHRPNRNSRKWKPLQKILSEEQKLMLPSTAAICRCLHICSTVLLNAHCICLCKYMHKETLLRVSFYAESCICCPCNYLKCDSCKASRFFV